MKIAAHIVATLLGLLFIAVSLMVLTGNAPHPELEPGSPSDHFMKAMGPTGYITFVKVLELVGGLLVLIPKTRNLGLLVLGPIVINICAYHILVMKSGFVGLPLIIGVFALFLLCYERRSFAALIH